MIIGLHVVIYSKDAEKDHQFLKDVLKFSHVDVGGGWIIFAAPPSEMSLHPTNEDATHEAYFMCDDVQQQDKELEESGCICAPIKDEGCGMLTSFTLPGGGTIGLYQPRYLLSPVNT